MGKSFAVSALADSGALSGLSYQWDFDYNGTFSSDSQQRNAAYLNHALATGRYPQLAGLLAPASPAQVSPAEEATAGPADRYRDILARILGGLLAPEI